MSSKLLLRGLVSALILNLKETAKSGDLMVLILRLGGWVDGWSVGQSEIKANSASVAVEVEVEVEAELGNKKVAKD